MFGSTTNNTGFGGFGTANTATTNTTTPSLFGSAPPTSTPSMFGSTAPSTTSSLFGSATATAPTSQPSFFGNTNASAPTTTPSLFGNATASAPTSTPSLFGSAPATTPSLFGSAPTSTPSLFGSAPTTTPSLFGSTGTTKPLFGATPAAGNAQPTNSMFNNPQAPAGVVNSAVPEKGYLDLDRCFPDTKVPHFVVTPEGITRSMVPANFFHGASARDTSVVSSESKSREPLLSSVGFSESNKALPFYLTSSQSNNSNTSNKSPIPNFSSKKRVLEGSQLDIGRNVIPKNEQGVFTLKDDTTTGFEKHLNGVGGAEPPRQSLTDTGIQTGGQAVVYQSNEITNSFGLFNSSVADNTKTRIRVFGYDGKDVDKIIQYFTNLGELSEPCKSQGNWITFNYVSPETALKAIECNGMNIDQNHLVGVTWDDRAKQVENLHYTTQDDLYKKSTSFLNMFNQQPGEQKLVDKIREKFLRW